MGRGRPKMSEEQKQANKAKREAAKAIHDWDARLPAHPEIRADLIGNLLSKVENLATSLKELRDEAHLSGEVKRLTSVYGLRKPAIKIALIMEKLPSREEQTAVFRQILMIGSDRKWDSAPGLFDVASVGKTAAEEGSIFDKTGAGERHASERTDDPGKASKRRGKGAAPIPPVDTGALSPEQAEAAFKANAGKAPKPASADNDDETDLRPRFLKDGDPTGEGPLPPRAPLEGADQGGSYKIVH